MNVESSDTSKAKDRPKNSRREAGAGGPPYSLTSAAALNDVRQQFVLNCCKLRLDHAVEVQLTAAREGQVFSCVRQCFWMWGVFNGGHPHEEGCRFRFGLITGPTDHFRERFDSFVTRNMLAGVGCLREIDGVEDGRPSASARTSVK